VTNNGKLYKQRNICWNKRRRPAKGAEGPIHIHLANVDLLGNIVNGKILTATDPISVSWDTKNKLI
jgi:hypothetical protein